MAEAKKASAGRKKTTVRAPARRSAGKKANGPVSNEERYRMVQEAAYYKAEQAGFSGDSVQFWLDAEQEVERRLNGG